MANLHKGGRPKRSYKTEKLLAEHDLKKEIESLREENQKLREIIESGDKEEGEKAQKSIESNEKEINRLEAEEKEISDEEGDNEAIEQNNDQDQALQHGVGKSKGEEQVAGNAKAPSNFQLEDQEPKPEDFKYECAYCGAYFNELEEKTRCPNCHEVLKDGE